MPEYKLVYFNLKGRGELIRWIFSYAGIPFIDERLTSADWPNRKESIPGGKLPVLYVNGKPLVQSIAIARYVAKEAGLVPSDNFEAALCDALADTIAEMMGEIYKVMFSKESEGEKERKLQEEVYPKTVKPILKRLDKRLSERQWFTSNKITWADLSIGLTCSELRKKNKMLLRDFSAVEAHVDKVLALPKIKEWVSKHP